MTETLDLPAARVRAAVARLHADGYRFVTVAGVAATMPRPVDVATIATTLRKLADDVGATVPGVRVVECAPRITDESVPGSARFTYELVSRGPVSAPTISPEALRSINGAFDRAGAAIAAMTESAFPVPPRPKWYRRGALGRLGFRFMPRDWTVGVTVGDEMVFISPLPCISVTFDRVGNR